MLYVLIPIYVIVCVFLILVVLLQQGKGADVASAFGASSSQTTFGARGATTLLEKITTWSFVAFAVLAVTISIVQSRGKPSVLSQQAAGKKAAPAVPGPAAGTGTAAPAPAAGAPATAAAVPVTAGEAGTTTAPATSAPAPAAPSTEAAPPATK